MDNSAIEDLNVIGESLVELPEPKPKKKKKLKADISSHYFRGSINRINPEVGIFLSSQKVAGRI